MKSHGTDPPRARTGWIAAVAALASACASPMPSAPPGSLVIAFETAPTNLDPRFATDEKSSLLGDLLYQGLMRIGATGEPELDLATSVNVVGRTQYVFRIRDDFRFHDGTALDAHDVRATYESVLDPATASPKREGLRMIDRIETPDDFTITFFLKEPHAPFLEATRLGILPEERLRSASGPVTIGCGPFRLTRFRRDQDVLLSANRDHPDGPPRLPAILFKIIPDDTVRLLELSKEYVHLAQNAVDPDSLAWLEQQEHLEVVSVPGTTFHYLGMNLRVPPFSDLRVRQALAHAIDRDAIIRHLLGGHAMKATGLLAPGHWAYTRDVDTYPYDPARARTLLDESGLRDPNGPEPRFRVLYKGSLQQNRRRFAEVLRQQLADVGIALEVRSYEWGTLYADIRRGNFQIYGLAWVGVSDPDVYYALFHSRMMPPNGNNRGGFEDPEIDRLTERGRAVEDRAVRRSIYERIQRRLATELPLIPLWWTPNVVVKHRRLRDFTPDPAGSLRSLRTAWLAPENVP